MKKIPTVNFKIQVFGTELDSWWRLKSSLLRRALKIVSPCRAFCIVLFSICVDDQTKTGEETPFASLKEEKNSIGPTTAHYFVSNFWQTSL